MCPVDSPLVVGLIHASLYFLFVTHGLWMELFKLRGANTLESLCERLEPIIEEFHFAAFAYAGGRGREFRRQVDREANNVVRVIRSARHAEIHLSEADWEWVDQLEQSARTITTLNRDVLRRMPEQEALDLLARIEGWFRVAAARCAEVRAWGSEVNHDSA